MYYYELKERLDPGREDQVITLAHRAAFTDDEFTTLVCNVLPLCAPADKTKLRFNIMRHGVARLLCERYGFELVEAWVDFVVPDRDLGRDPATYLDETSRRLAQKLKDAGISTPAVASLSMHWSADTRLSAFGNYLSDFVGKPTGKATFQAIKARSLDHIAGYHAETIVMDEMAYHELTRAVDAPPPPAYPLAPSSLTGGETLKARVLDDAVRALASATHKPLQVSMQAHFVTQNKRRKR
jgi:hypothetical protein